MRTRRWIFWRAGVACNVTMTVALAASSAAACGAQDSLLTAGPYRLGIVAGWEHTYSATNPYTVRPFGFGANLTVSRSVGTKYQIGVGGRYAEHYPALQTTRFACWFGEFRYYGWPAPKPGRAAGVREFVALRAGYIHVWGPISGTRGGGLEIAPTGGYDVRLSRNVTLEVQGGLLLQLVDGSFGSQFGLYVGSVFGFGPKGGGE